METSAVIAVAVIQSIWFQPIDWPFPVEDAGLFAPTTSGKTYEFRFTTLAAASRRPGRLDQPPARARDRIPDHRKPSPQGETRKKTGVSHLFYGHNGSFRLEGLP